MPIFTPVAAAPVSQPTPPAASGGAGGGLMALMFAAQAVGGAVSSFEQDTTRRAIERTRRRIAAMRAQQAEAMVRQRGRKAIGAQRAAYAAQGIRTDFGSPMDVKAETETISELDALTIKNNALREGFGYDVAGGIASAQSQVRTVDTLLTGGLNAYMAYKGMY